MNSARAIFRSGDSHRARTDVLSRGARTDHFSRGAKASRADSASRFVYVSRGIFIAAAFACSAGACGYSIASGARLPGGGRELKVAPFLNQTALAEAGGLFSAAARDVLAAHGRLAPEGDPNAFTLNGELRMLHDTTSALGATGASAFHIDVEVMLRVIGPQGTVYEDDARSGDDYLQGIDVLGTEVNRRAAIRRAADKLMREALERMELSGG